MLKARHLNSGPVYLEDESRLVGRCALPESLKERMARSPLLILEQPMEERIGIIREDYVEGMYSDYVDRDGAEAGWLNFRDYLLSAIDRIRKRLGGERHQQLRGLMDQALLQQEATGETAAHNAWIQSLLQDYYDPMYDYQLGKKEGRILVRGGPKTILDWANKSSVA
jgi:tRNA 2-selenouridine synthase